MTPWLVPVAYVLGALAGGFGVWSLWAWPARRRLQRVQAELLIAETQLRDWKARALESAELERKARACVEQATRRAIAAEQELKRTQAPASLPVRKRPCR